MKWTDTVLLRRESGQWRIVDIRFEQGGSLVQSLRAFVGLRCSGGD